MATSTMLPTSNVAGNNQTSPGLLRAGAKPIDVLPFGTGASGSNPYFQAPSTGTPSAGGLPGQTVGSPINPSSVGSIYNPASSQSSGESDIQKQLIDILGKGVGGDLNYILQNMSGTDSAIFKQWLAGMQPVWQQQKVGLTQGLGSEGVGANSSVNAIAQADLAGQQSAQASQENSQLMTQQLQDTLGVLTGLENPAIKEVASSGWDVFASVMNNITGDVGNLLGGSYQSPSAQGLSSGSDTSMGDEGGFGSDTSSTGTFSSEWY